MARTVKIAIVGGGSFNWSPTILRDVILTEGLEGTEFRLLDIKRENAETVAALGRKLAQDWGLPATFHPTTKPEEAIKGADFVIITVSTGGLDAMQHDLRIPEKYGIFQTVGDTVGPGGWSRALRNIPVFVDLGRLIARLAPKAAILNYTNPLTVLTKTLCTVTHQPVVGLCHGMYEDYAMLKAVFGLEGEQEIKANAGGLNHFFWMMDLRIRGEDGYELLRRKIGRKTLADVIRAAHTEGAGFHRDAQVCSELFHTYGILTYSADRHTSEFFSSYIAPTEKRLGEYKIVRTSIAERRQAEKGRAKRMQEWLNGKRPFPKKRSREAAADIVRGMALGREFVDLMNVPNEGQIANLPMGAVVETLGVISPLGFKPSTVGPIPEPIATLLRRHIVNQEMVVEAAMTGNRDEALWALINDPACSHLTVPQVRAMADALLKANAKLLPQFRK